MKDKLRIFLFVGLLFAGAILVSACTNQQKTPGGQGTPVGQQAQTGQPSATQLIADDAVLGNQNVPVTIIEFGDFECPFCAKVFLETEPKIREDYIKTGKVKWVMRDFISPYHNKGDEAAIAAECAGAQGKYFEMHDKLFSNSFTGDNWGDDPKIGRRSGYDEAKVVRLFKNYAKELGLDAAKFNRCLDSKQFADDLAKDKSDGQAAGITGTPSFLIGNDKNGFTKVVGAQPYAVFKQVIEAKLQG